MENVVDNPASCKPGTQENCAFSSSGFAFTLLPDLYARTKRFIQLESTERFAGCCLGTISPNKSELPLLSMARFGREPSDKGCLRHKGNVKALTGCCGDYDGPRNGAAPLTLEAIETRLREAQPPLEAVISETPSSTPEAFRGRMWCPDHSRGLRLQRAAAGRDA